MANQDNNTPLINDSRELARAIVAVLIEKKALDICMYSVADESSITDYYINVTGRSSTQVGALADEVTYKISLLGRDELRVEGRSLNSWLLVDYGDVILNVFDRQSREYYNFDRLLPEGSIVNIDDIIKEVDKKLGIEEERQ